MVSPIINGQLSIASFTRIESATALSFPKDRVLPLQVSSATQNVLQGRIDDMERFIKDMNHSRFEGFSEPMKLSGSTVKSRGDLKKGPLPEIANDDKIAIELKNKNFILK